MSSVIERLAEAYPQLFLDPDKDTQEAYRRVVLRGEDPEMKCLDHYQGSEYDQLETVETPVGKVRVATLGNRKDFELVMRSFMAAKVGPLSRIPETQGAAMLSLFNWPRIHRHLASFPEEERVAEFKRFISVKENYIDPMIVLSRGPYSGVAASLLGSTDEEWIARSDTIRRYHELTHVICRRLYPDQVDAVRDELIADAVGLYAAYGNLDVEKEQLFLGIQDGRYIGGRLENYAEAPDQQAGIVCIQLERMKKCIDAHLGVEPFDLIPLLMDNRQP